MQTDREPGFEEDPKYGRLIQKLRQRKRDELSDEFDRRFFDELHHVQPTMPVWMKVKMVLGGLIGWLMGSQRRMVIAGAVGACIIGVISYLLMRPMTVVQEGSPNESVHFDSKSYSNVIMRAFYHGQVLGLGAPSSLNKDTERSRLDEMSPSAPIMVKSKVSLTGIDSKQLIRQIPKQKE